MIVPAETELTAPYWAAARRGEVLLQRCAACAHVWHPPGPVCPACSGSNWAWFTSAGTGVVRAVTEVVHAAHGQVQRSLPYVLVLVELAEGPLFLCGLEARGPDGADDADDADDAGELLGNAHAVTIVLGYAAGGLRLPMARPS